MNNMIGHELYYLAASFIWGVLLMSCYDILRILRKIVPHPFIWVAIEDLSYWLSGGFLVFRMIYGRNDGTIRGYSVVALLLGMLLYYAVVGERVVRLVSGVWHRIWDAVKRCVYILLRPVRFMARKIRKLMKNVRNMLKSIKKTVTIAVSRR